MRFFTTTTIILTLGTLTSLADDHTAAPAEPTDMVPLFNGTDLAGWDGDPRLWSVRDGVIHGETTPDTVAQGNTFLIWKGRTNKRL